MRVVRSIHELDLPWGQPIGFAPTMGALHEGHLSLMRAAKSQCGFCVASVFVNPTQFGPTEDFSKYPRNEDRDFALAESAGVDVMFAPSVSTMYPETLTSVHVAQVTDLWEGALRPGHFDGVATIVNKLFNIVRPTHAYFGWKDFQQCVVIRRMVVDLNMPVQLVFNETVREPDGLAMSSRNAYLTPDERVRAPILYRSLLDCRAEILASESVEACLMKYRDQVTAEGLELQYFSCVDGNTLLPIQQATEGARLIIAAKLGSTRLIDNCAVI